MEKILRGPWIKQEMEKSISTDSGEEHYKALTLSICDARRELQRVGGPFITSSEVLPIHCKNALNALGELKENVAAASQSLHHTDSIAVILSPSRYPLLATLYTIEEQALQLIVQLDTYRITCLEPSRHVRRQQWEIVSQLEDISQQLADIPELTKSLDEDIESRQLYLSESDINVDQSPSAHYPIEHPSTGKSSRKGSHSFPKKQCTISNTIIPMRQPGKASSTKGLLKNNFPCWLTTLSLPLAS